MILSSNELKSTENELKTLAKPTNSAA